MQATDAVRQTDIRDNNIAYEFKGDQFPQLPNSTQSQLYQSMESCALSQLILFTREPKLLATLKWLVESIHNETLSYQRTQVYNDGSTYLKVISLIDSLEVIDHIEKHAKHRETVNRKLQKQISQWKVPRHLVIKVIKDLMRQKNTPSLLIEPIMAHNLNGFELRYNKERNKLISANLKLVFSIAKRYRFLGLSYEDLVQEGSIGLLRSIERFDPTKGYLFSTYAYTAISHHIHSAIEKQSSVVRRPYDQLKDKAIADKTRAKLEQKLARPPRSKEYKASLPDSINNKTPYIALNTHATANIDRYQQSPEPEEHELMGRTDQDEKTQSLLYKRDINSLLLSLDERKQTILRMRYGIGINRTYTLKEISEILFISSERVRQLCVSSEKELQLLIQIDPDEHLDQLH
jgi:RNA polymerase sigma factor (sigma-70 family)